VKEDAHLHQVVKDELGNRGYVVTVHARRDGDFVVGGIEITSAETDETVGKIVGAGKMENLNLCFGVDAEGTLREALVRALTTWQGVQSFMPAIVVKPAKP